MARKDSSNAAKNDGGQDHLLDDETMRELSVLSLDPGGEAPAKSELVLKGASKAIGNELKKNQEVLLMVHAQVVDVHFPADKRRHILEIVDMYEETSAEAVEGLSAEVVVPEGVDKDTGEIVDGEIVDEPETEDDSEEEAERLRAEQEEAAMGEAAGDLDWN